MHHALPTGATPVPLNIFGERVHNGWDFYEGWTGGTMGRKDAENEMLPESRHGCLDKDKLKEMGLTKRRMRDPDALFFYQLLFPICDPNK